MAVLALAVGAACSNGGGASSDGRVAVVASTSVWGSLAAQVGGDRVAATSLLQGQNVDAHDYEPKPADGRAVARARYVVVNGLGYDEWASKLLAANRSSDRTVLDVGELVGLREGDNPHRWYAPDDVRRVVERLASDLASIDAAHAAEYQQRRDALLTSGMREYFDLIAAIRRDHSGIAVGATESVASPLIEALGLRLASPASFLAAVAEGVDPTPQDKATMEAQIRGRQVRVLIVNRQNVTPDVQRLVEAAKAADVPTVDVTETPPADTSFQAWQVGQLQALAAALRAAR
ncbi:MAG: zinc ABC transporter substrate-binding protein [Dehalococcoidia bacterium]